MVKRRKIHHIIGAGLCSLMFTSAASAQWQVVQETPPGVDRRIDIAIIDNNSGHSLRLYKDDVQNLRGVFTIRGGFDTIDPAVCPTYRVDERKPKRVTLENDRCRVRLKQAEFTLGPIGLEDNRDLHRIMNGSDIIFRYRLGGGNYRETKFTLRGSKYALTTAIDDPTLGFDE
jgi:hypothetical protein